MEEGLIRSPDRWMHVPRGRAGMRLRFAGDISARVYQDWVAVVAVGATLVVMGQVKAERHGAAVTMHGRTFQLDAETFPSPLPSATSDKQPA
jgi:hypothetical protein